MFWHKNADTQQEVLSFIKSLCNQFLSNSICIIEPPIFLIETRDPTRGLNSKSYHFRSLQIAESL